MPVVMGASDYSRWLDPASPAADLLSLLDSRVVEGMEVAAANPTVNTRYDAPRLHRGIVARRPIL